MKKETMMKRATFLCLVALTVLTLKPAVLAADETSVTVAANKGLAYLKGQQETDGSYISFDGTVNATSGIALAVASAGLDVNMWKTTDASNIDYLGTQTAILSNPGSLSANTAKIALLVMTLVASGHDPKTFAGTDWVGLLFDAYNPTTGAFGGSFIQHPWALIAVNAAGETVPANAVDCLTTNQEADGGFGFNGLGSGSDTNTTSLCLEALAACGESPSDTPIQQAIGYLHTQQNDDGGFPWAKPSPWGIDSDSSSTAWVIQALIAAGEDRFGPSWTQNGNTPVDFLLSMQNDDGAFSYQSTWPDDNLMSTYQAIPALMGKAFPLDYTAPVRYDPLFVNLPGAASPINVAEGQVITENPFTVLVRPSSPFGIAYVELYIDGVLVGTAYVPNVNGVYGFLWDTGRYHSTLRIVAYDTLGNSSDITRDTTVVPADMLPYTGR